MRICGLDLSLTGSGVALIDTDWPGHARLTEHGTKPTLPDLESRSIRLRTVASKVINDCRDSDIVAIEDLFMGQGTGAQLDRAGLWWIVVNSLCANGIPVVPITNNHLKMWATGKGAGKGTDKDHVLAATVKRFPHANVVSNNTADALNLASLTAFAYGFPVGPDMPLTNRRAINAVKWPPLTVADSNGTGRVIRP